MKKQYCLCFGGGGGGKIQQNLHRSHSHLEFEVDFRGIFQMILVWPKGI